METYWYFTLVFYVGDTTNSHSDVIQSSTNHFPAISAENSIRQTKIKAQWGNGNGDANVVFACEISKEEFDLANKKK